MSAVYVQIVREQNVILHNGSVNNKSPHYRSTILEIIHWTQTAYDLLYQPQHKDVLFSFKSKRKHM